MHWTFVHRLVQVSRISVVGRSETVTCLRSASATRRPAPAQYGPGWQLRTAHRSSRSKHPDDSGEGWGKNAVTGTEAKESNRLSGILWHIAPRNSLRPQRCQRSGNARAEQRINWSGRPGPSMRINQDMCLTECNYARELVTQSVR